MKIVSLMLILILSGCSLFSSSRQTNDYAVDLDIKESEVLHLKNIEFVVITKSNSDSVINKESVVFALTETNYKALAENIEKIKEHLKLQKKIILEYKKYYGTKKEN